MPSPQIEVLQSLRSSQFTLQRYVPALSPVDRSPERGALDLAIRNADRALWGQSLADAAAQSCRSEIKHLRDSLWEGSLQPTVGFAHTHLSCNPEALALELPARTRSAGALILFAYALIGVLDHNADAFQRAGLPNYVLPRLSARTTALSTEVQKLADSVAWQRRARQELADALQHGRSAIALLHVRMLDQFSARPDVLEAWKRAKSVRARAERTPVAMGRAA